VPGCVDLGAVVFSADLLETSRAKLALPSGPSNITVDARRPKPYFRPRDGIFLQRLAEWGNNMTIVTVNEVLVFDGG